MSDAVIPTIAKNNLEALDYFTTESLYASFCKDRWGTFIHHMFLNYSYQHASFFIPMLFTQLEAEGVIVQEDPDG